jgi:membrane-bound serine protease (ClpP class)
MGLHADGFLRTVWRLAWPAVWLLSFGLAGMGAEAAEVIVLQVQDAIGPASADYVVRGIAKAHKGGAKLVVIELDTPGGLDTSMRQIIQAILASPIPVATWVAPEGARAASAGTYILYSSHIAAMAPSTTLGAATPVAIGMQPSGEHPASGSKSPGDAMTAKAVNDAAAFIRGLAHKRGRNAEWAERAVREAVTLTAEEALHDKVIDVVARDVDDLLARINGRQVRVSTGDITLATRGASSERVLPDWRHRLLSVIANPSFALILMMIGIYGLMFEFASPGFGVAGVAGGICLLLGLFALQLLPINYAGLALLTLGLALMAAEAVTPTFGVLGGGGAIAFIAGGILLIDSDLPGYGVPLPLILGLAATSMLVVVAGGGLALRAHRRPVQTGSESMAGTVGEIIEVGEREAWATVRGERWKVHSDTPLAPGQRVRVRSLRGLVLDVAPDDSRTTAKEGTP